MLQNKICSESRDYIFGSILTGVYDVNRNELLEDNDFGIIQKWYDSILKLKIKAIVFHNTFSEEIIQKYTNEYIQFIEVPYDGRLKPNVYRYFLYRNYLKQHPEKIQNLFLTDITDVEVINNPFESQTFIENSDSLFCGDEPEILDNEWMWNHNSHLRNSLPEFSSYESSNQNQTLLNCGVIGSNVDVMNLLLDEIVAIHEAVSYTNTTKYTLDMGVFNYVARTTFANKIVNGEPVNTVFKKYENQRTDCWFKHK